jgi:hypothetical protein
MILKRLRNWFFAISSVALAGSAFAASAIKNVVLVHRAFVDGSGYKLKQLIALVAQPLAAATFIDAYGGQPV